MEQISRTYGRFLLEAVVFGLLFVLLFWGITDEKGNRGIFRIMGEYVQEELRNIAGADLQIYQAEGQKEAPVISYVNGEMRHVGVYMVESLLQAEDYTGRLIPVKVLSICDPNGMERIGEYSNPILQIQFAERGIYVLEVSATDAWNRTCTYRVCVPINI